jgi:hypothetical protein
VAKRTCKHPGGCPRIHYAHGYCNPHWRRWKRTGDPGPAEIKPYASHATCTGPECDRQAESLGLCATHYAQHRRGLPLTPIRERNGRTPQRDLALWGRYRITVAQYDALLASQHGKCAICKAVNASGRDLAVDHDHACCPGARSCGKCVRSLLCSRCNIGIGQFLDSPELMRAAAAYVEGWRQ